MSDDFDRYDKWLGALAAEQPVYHDRSQGITLSMGKVIARAVGPRMEGQREFDQFDFSCGG